MSGWGVLGSNACPSPFSGISPQALTILHALASVWGVTGATVVTPLLSHTNASPTCMRSQPGRVWGVPSR